MKDTNTLTVIIPCYNEEEAIPIFYNKVTKILLSTSIDFELLFINDGSTDKTLSILKDLSSNDNRTNYLSFSRNFGKESALYAGLCNSNSDFVCIMDVDLQDPPELLPQMLSLLQNNPYDCIATRRSSRKGEPLIRSFFSRMFYKFVNSISDFHIEDGARDFRLMKRDMVQAIVSMTEYNRFSKGLFSWVGFNTYWLSYDNIERCAGKTKWSFIKLFKYAIDGIINFSQAPLKIASWAGFTITLISFIYLISIIIRKLIYGNSVEGWASQVCIALFLGGIQLFSIGIMGQYLAKTYMETKHRPHYIISDTNKTNLEKIR